MTTRFLGVLGPDADCGKTSTAVHLALVLSYLGRDTLLLDLGTDGDASRALGALDGDEEPGQLGDARPRDVNGWEHLSVLRLDGPAFDAGPERVRRELGAWDYVISDLPSIDDLPVAACRILDSVVLVCRCHRAALQGMARCLQTVTSLKGSEHPGLTVAGLLITMADKKLQQFEAMLLNAVRHFPVDIFPFAIPVEEGFPRPHSPGELPLDSRAMRGYVELTMEVLADE